LQTEKLHITLITWNTQVIQYYRNKTSTFKNWQTSFKKKHVFFSKVKKQTHKKTQQNQPTKKTPQKVNLPNLSAPARPRITVTGLFGFVQNWCKGGKKASRLFSNCKII